MSGPGIIVRGGRHTVGAALAAAVLLGPSLALAQAPAPTDARAEANAHFKAALALYKDGAWAAALAEFLESRRLYPQAWSTTSYAATCLQKLQRYDEALDLFEALLRDHGERLPPEAKEAAQRALVAMRALVGTLEPSGAEPGAEITVDGSSRGEYPPVAPLRVAAGSHTVRFFKEGFEPFEKRVEVAGQATVHVEAPMRPLAASGRLRVSEQGGRALEVVVDGSRVGKAPWEGRVAAGPHVVVLRGEGDLGTPPVPVTVGRDRTVPLTLTAEELAAVVRVEPTPANAGVAIDSVSVGNGVWEGRLRAGAHTVEVAAPGFAPARRAVSLARGQREVVTAALERDERSPFWKKPPRKPRFLVEAAEGVALVPSFGGGVAGACIGACKLGVGVGGMGAVHAGYELGPGLGFGVTLGYLGASQGVTGRSTSLKPVGLPDDKGHADDRLALRGALAGVWAGFTLGERVPVHFRLGAGGLFGTVLDDRRGSFTANVGKSSYALATLEETHAAGFVYVAPEVRVALPLGHHVELNAGVAAPILIAVRAPAWDAAHPVHAGKDGYGTFAADPLVGAAMVAVTPGLGARYDF